MSVLLPLFVLISDEFGVLHHRCMGMRLPSDQTSETSRLVDPDQCSCQETWCSCFPQLGSRKPLRCPWYIHPQTRRRHRRSRWVCHYRAPWANRRKSWEELPVGIHMDPHSTRTSCTKLQVCRLSTGRDEASSATSAPVLLGDEHPSSQLLTHTQVPRICWQTHSHFDQPRTKL